MQPQRTVRENVVILLLKAKGDSRKKKGIQDQLTVNCPEEKIFIAAKKLHHYKKRRDGLDNTLQNVAILILVFVVG